jgi:hypothetical protein
MIRCLPTNNFRAVRLKYPLAGARVEDTDIRKLNFVLGASTYTFNRFTKSPDLSFSSGVTEERSR